MIKVALITDEVHVEEVQNSNRTNIAQRDKLLSDVVRVTVNNIDDKQIDRSVKFNDNTLRTVLGDNGYDFSDVGRKSQKHTYISEHGTSYGNEDNIERSDEYDFVGVSRKPKTNRILISSNGNCTEGVVTRRIIKHAEEHDV